MKVIVSGFCVIGGIPKIGTLMNCAWSLNDSCTFRVHTAGQSEVKTEKPKDQSTGAGTTGSTQASSQPVIDTSLPPPSPASSTCSETSSISTSTKRKRTLPKDEDGDKTQEWNLKDVVILEDSKNAPIGRVLKVDGIYAAVKFPSKDAKETKEVDDPLSILSDCRLMRKDELLVLKPGSSPKTPELIQRAPKLVNIVDGGHIYAMSLDTQGKAIHVT